MSEYYAHSLEGKPPKEWHKLEDHLKGTAELAAKFAAEFGCGEPGFLAGLRHDLGKYSANFQKMLFVSSDAHLISTEKGPAPSVAPLAGAWIETSLSRQLSGRHRQVFRVDGRIDKLLEM